MTNKVVSFTPLEIVIIDELEDKILSLRRVTEYNNNGADWISCQLCYRTAYLGENIQHSPDCLSSKLATIFNKILR